MVEQLDHLAQDSRRPNVRLGILEWTHPAKVRAMQGSRVYDFRAVLLGTVTATLIVTDRQEISDYKRYWTELEPLISYDTARAAIERVAAYYRSISEQQERT